MRAPQNLRGGCCAQAANSHKHFDFCRQKYDWDGYPYWKAARRRFYSKATASAPDPNKSIFQMWFKNVWDFW